MSEVRLIDANALKLMKVVECAGHTIEYAAGWKRCVEYCKNDAPTVDAVPVVRHGKWTMRETAWGTDEAKCSECGFEMLVNEPGNGLRMVNELLYCPHCGAKMDGADGERR